MNAPRPVLKIMKYTVLDEVRQKSFGAMCLLCLLFIFLLRGCYQGNYVVNGEALSASAVAQVVSTTVFHGITILTMLIVALLSSRLFKRDRETGMQSLILSKPVTRKHYVHGRVLGLWVLSTSFMLLLQVAVFLVAVLSTGAVMPGYIAASSIACINLLFVILIILLLSLIMSDVAAFLCLVGIGVIGMIIDGVSLVSGQMGGVPAIGDLSVSRIVSRVWPKLLAMESFASSFIGDGGHQSILSFYPLFNIIFYCFIFWVLLLYRFGREELS
jgi:ABC-type transport system involved in multi-copper enzyme maturation permease subunit